MLSYRSAIVLGLLLFSLLAPPGGKAQGRPPDLDAVDPIRHDYDEAIVEHAQVTVRNQMDQIWVDLIRPDTDEPVPTILIASPYYNTLGRGWRGELKSPHQGPAIPTSPGFPALSGDSHVPFPEWYDEYFVPRGYAVALMDLRGTRNSSGCQEYGDRKEVFDTVDVIDWIAERPWSNGKVGMTGGSYDGTIATGAAAEAPMSARHPDALAAIIPIRAIDRWYDYAFVNGAQITSQSLITPSLFTAAFPAGDTQSSGTDDTLLPVHVVERKACIATFGAAVSAGHAAPYQDARAPFWRQRDFARTAGLFRAATFVIHGIFDYNVKSHNAGYLWEALPDTLPRKLWLCNCEHSDPHQPDATSAHSFPFQAQFVEATHRWFAQFLKGTDAGALKTPEVEIQDAAGVWRDGGPYPASDGDVDLWLSPDGTLEAEGGSAGSAEYRDAATGTAPSSVRFTSEPFDADTRISGQFGFDLEMAAEGPDATVAVEVVAVPPGVDPSASPTTVMDGSNTQPLLLSYGWFRAWYRDSVPLRGLSTPTGGGPLEPGERTGARFGSLYTDLVVPAGHSLSFRFSAAEGGTLASNLGGTVTLFTGPDGSRILVPVASAADDAEDHPARGRRPPHAGKPPGVGKPKG